MMYDTSLLLAFDVTVVFIRTWILKFGGSNTVEQPLLYDDGDIPDGS